jgi:hypothetical protein
MSRVVERKLGRERAHGLHEAGTKTLVLDPRLKERHRLRVLIHEWFHRHDLASRDAHARMEDGDEESGRAIEEADVARLSADLEALMTAQGYRRVRL